MNPGAKFLWAVALAVLQCGLIPLAAQTNGGVTDSASPTAATNAADTSTVVTVATNETPMVASNAAVVTEVSGKSEERTPEKADAPEPRPATASGGTDFASFRIVSERNIFNGNRAAGSGVRFTSTRSSTTRRDAVVESFTLVGVLVSDRSRTAFFDGSSPEFSGTLSPGEKIADFRVKEILHAGVCLEEGTNTIEIAVGSGLRREDQGLWKHSDSGGSLASSWSSSGGSGGFQAPERTSDNGGRSSWGRSSRNGFSRGTSGDSRSSASPPTTSSSSSSPPGDTDAILRRLREQREKE